MGVFEPRNKPRVRKDVYGDGLPRVENERLMLFKSHYGFDASHFEPGLEGLIAFEGVIGA